MNKVDQLKVELLGRLDVMRQLADEFGADQTTWSDEQIERFWDVYTYPDGRLMYINDGLLNQQANYAVNKMFRNAMAENIANGIDRELWNELSKQ